MKLSLAQLKSILIKGTPPFILSTYYFLFAFLGAWWYGFPSRRMTVIGVTGTKGKTTTCNLIADILDGAEITTGLPAVAWRAKAGLASTVNFRIGGREWVNDTKQTMLGRFALQKLLREMADAGCTHAVVETSSEGILQHRHRFIDYRAAVFTNLSPEHIERHGGFGNYRAAKVKLFAQVAKRSSQDGGGIGVYNCDDENVSWFLAPPVAKKYGFFLPAEASAQAGLGHSGAAACPVDATVRVSDIALHADRSEFSADGVRYEMPLIGEFNVRNAAAAIAIGTALGIPTGRMQEGLARAKAPAGRMEVVRGNAPFTVIVDYSYEPKSLESALRAVRVFNPARIIVLTGSAGGGRDVWRRPVMGETAAKFADIVIATTDDPYDEDPEKIVDEVLAGAKKDPRRVMGENLFRIADRRGAIGKAIALAGPGDVVLIAGKGGERWMNVKEGKIPWDDVKIAEEALRDR